MSAAKKFLCYLIAALIFFAIISGGCGGHNLQHSGNEAASRTNYTNPNQYQQDTIPDSYNENSYSLNQLTGTWLASNGSGTGTGATGNYTFSVNCQATLGEFDSSGTTFATINEAWYVYQNGYFVTRILFEPDSEHMKLTNIGVNTWRATFPDGGRDVPDGGDVTIMLTSANTAHVRESGIILIEGEYYNYNAEYTMVKY